MTVILLGGRRQGSGIVAPTSERPVSAAASRATGRIAQRIRATSEDVLQVDTGSLYPALHRLARKRWIRAEWVVSEKGQRVREYRLTGDGQEQLAAARNHWEQLSEAMARILAPPQESGA